MPQPHVCVPKKLSDGIDKVAAQDSLSSASIFQNMNKHVQGKLDH